MKKIAKMSKHNYPFDCHYNGYENDCTLKGCRCDYNGLQNASKCKDFITEDDWIGAKGYEQETTVRLSDLRNILTTLQAEYGDYSMTVDELMEKIRERL